MHRRRQGSVITVSAVPLNRCAASAQQTHPAMFAEAKASAEIKPLHEAREDLEPAHRSHEMPSGDEGPGSPVHISKLGTGLKAWCHFVPRFFLGPSSSKILNHAGAITVASSTVKLAHRIREQVCNTGGRAGGCMVSRSQVGLIHFCGGDVGRAKHIPLQHS